MDSRNTLNYNDTFTNMLSACMEMKTNVAILFDNNGLIRAEGFVKVMKLNVTKPYIEMEHGFKIVLDTITAVNGIFVHSYSAC